MPANFQKSMDTRRLIKKYIKMSVNKREREQKECMATAFLAS